VTLEIILLALVAAFLGLRLYSVLGKRTGHEQEPMIRRPIEERSAPLIPAITPNKEALGSGAVIASADIAPGAENGLRAIINADRQFDAELFLEGAKSAYKMTLEAYWAGERVVLQSLCDDDVLEQFTEVIANREERGETLENRLIRIENARIVDAEYDHPMARVTVRFDADIAALVKDADGNIIGGSMTDAVEAHDIWTFSRDLKSGNLNWILDTTDAD
jgi:predicted lipid-binding transport protein (Tim44 family)